MPERDIKEFSRQKEELLAMLAHELRNPLAPIRTGIQLLRSSQTCRDRTLDVMERQVKHLINLVDDLLDVSRISKRKINLKLEQVEFRRIIELALETMDPSIQNSRLRLRVNADDSEPYLVLGDVTRLTQIILNLLSNATKFNKEEGSIEVNLSRAGDSHLLLSVKDSGLGLPSDMIDGIFEMFTQVKDTIHCTKGGLGLGLALVKELVHLHGGTVWAESQGIGQGSVFKIKLPLYTEEEREMSDVATPEKEAEKSDTKVDVLIVDDNADAAEMMAMFLEGEGFSVRTAHNGTQALTLAGEVNPAAILLDIGLPDMDGYDVGKLLRAKKQFATTTLIALTGFGDDLAREKIKEIGFDHHLVKPADLTVVETMVRDARNKIERSN